MNARVHPTLHALTICAAFQIPCAAAVAGEVRFDGSLGGATGLAELVGKEFLIEESRGKRAGANLFHSFSTFNLSPDAGARFTGSSGIERLLARVTGGRSTINGPIISDIGGADLFLMNPAGIVFHDGARLDLGGSFFATTADSMGFADGGEFGFAEGEPVSLTFSGSPTPIRVEGTNSTLPISVKEGESISLVAGDIELRNADLRAPAGEINLVSVGSRGNVHLGHAGGHRTFNLNEFSELGSVELIASTVNSDPTEFFGRGVRGGRVVIRGGQLQLLESSIVVDGATEPGHQISIDVRDEVVIGPGSALRSFGGDSSGRGQIEVSGGSVVIDGTFSFAEIRTGPGSPADGGAGNVIINSPSQVAMIDGGRIRSTGTELGGGGNIQVAAGALTIDGRGQGVLTGIRANAADVDVQVSGPLEILDHGEISTEARSRDNAGDIRIHAGEISLDHSRNVAPNPDFTTAIFSRSGDPTRDNPTPGTNETGRGGNVSVTAIGKLRITGGARIDASALGHGNGGEIMILAGDIVLDGDGSDLRTGIVNFSGEGFSGATGDAGKIQVESNEAIHIRDGALIDSSTFGPGQAGSVEVTARRLLLIDRAGARLFTGIGSDTDNQGSGNAGQVSATAWRIELRDGGLISSATFGSGDSGSVRVVANELLVHGAGTPHETVVIPESGVVATSSGSGNAGNVIVDAGRVNVRDRGVIGSQSSGSGDAGSVEVSSRSDVRVTRRGQITVESLNTDAGQVSVQVGRDIHLENGAISARAGVDGGNVDLSAQGRISLRDGSEVVAEAGGNGGNVTARDAVIILLDDSRISANAIRGDGGRIVISCDFLLANGISAITASSEFGVDGEVLIDSLVDLSDRTPQLEAERLKPEQEISFLDPSKAPEDQSTFVTGGRGGVRPGLDGYLPSKTIWNLPAR